MSVGRGFLLISKQWQLGDRRNQPSRHWIHQFNAKVRNHWVAKTSTSRSPEGECLATGGMPVGQITSKVSGSTKPELGALGAGIAGGGRHNQSLCEVREEHWPLVVQDTRNQFFILTALPQFSFF